MLNSLWEENTIERSKPSFNERDDATLNKAHLKTAKHEDRSCKFEIERCDAKKWEEGT